MGLTPKVEELPKEERISELLGHIVWMNAIDYVRSAQSRFGNSFSEK